MIRARRCPTTTVRWLALAVAATLGAGCSPSGDQYEARIRRTSYGVAHIEASDLASLGFGEGYAQAEDHLCSIADQVVRARGERAKYFGPGEDDVHLLNDAGFKALRMHGRAAEDLAAQEEDLQAWYEGFVSGYNLYLEKTGRDNVPGWCRGADWVFPISAVDLLAYHRSVVVIASRFASMMAAARPPAAGGVARQASIPRFSATPELGASNGWALGRDWTESGRGMLIANPHYPWVGSNRFWEKHLVVAGELEVYGVGLLGVPGVTIGFNRAVAWTHTVSAGTRYTLYELDLVSGSPTSYSYEGEEREMIAHTVTVDVRQEDGSVESVERIVWFSHFGPVIDFPDVGWTAGRVLALRDVNRDDDEAWGQWLDMNRARSMAEFQQAHAKYQGMPWVNTIATSAEGLAWYTDSSSTPNLSAEAIERWLELRQSDSLTRRAWQRGVVVLPGNSAVFEWQDDPDARDPGVMAFEDMPQVERTDYVFNANDSFWLTNSSAPIEGDYSPLLGSQRTVRSLRTRNNDLTLSHRSPDRPAGDDRKFSLDEMAAALLENRSLTAELLKPELVERCEASPRVTLGAETIDLEEACTVLAAWDDRYDVGSRGAALFREWIGRYEPADLRDGGRLFAVGFDPEHPVHTPRGLAPGGLAVENLARAVRLLRSRDLPLDVALGELQYALSKTAKRIPIHGGQGFYEGVMNMQRSGRNASTLEPLTRPARVEGSRFLTEEGYPVVHGSSFVMALEFTDDGPRAKAFLTYSQSGVPTSPHFTDQTELFSRKQWRPILFEEAQIEANLEREYTVTRPKQRRVGN
ncbi:MAG: acylase [Acidobacteria bacterium]|nr:acylase [Acidobacteriota bacterium]